MDRDKKICRLCLEEISDNNYVDIDETKRDILEILLLNIDFDICDHAVLCSRCQEKIQSCFDFISTCFCVDDYITSFVNYDSKVDIRKLFQKVNKQNVNLENCQICRLCMSLIEDGTTALHYTSDRKEGAFVEDMIVNCLPEVDLNTVLEPLICKPCLSRMKSYYEFMESCREVEERIKNCFAVAVDHDIASKKSLLDVAKFKNCDMISEERAIKLEYPDIQYVNVNAMNNLQNEGPVSMETEEIIIKNELDGVEIEDVNCSEDTNSSGKNDSSKKNKVSKRTKKAVISVPIPAYSTNVEDYLLRHKCNNHMAPRVHCNHIKNRTPLRLHQKTHRPTDQKFKCNQCEHTAVFSCRKCDFKNTCRKSVMSHMKTCLKKDDTEESVTLQCSQCDFHTKCRNSFSLHEKTHDPTKQKFQCDQCAFSSHYSSSFNRHLLTHMELGETEAYVCATCGFKTKHKDSIRRHIESCSKAKKDDRGMLQCNQCDFLTKRGCALSAHKRTHATTKHQGMCEQWNYDSDKRSKLDRHVLMHMPLEEPILYYCATCDYKSKSKHSLSNHIKRCLKKKKDDPDVMLQCNECDFCTKSKRAFYNHKLINDLSKYRYKCQQCEYCTYDRSRLNRHLVTHMKPGEVTIYNCEMCHFTSKHKRNVTSHMKKCLKMKEKGDVDSRVVL